MDTIALNDKFSASGSRLLLLTLKISDESKTTFFYPRYDYAHWSSNVIIFAKTGSQRKKRAFYIKQHIDFLNIYDVIDSETGKSIGTIRYHFGNWEIIDSDDNYFIISRESPLKELFTFGSVPYYIADEENNFFGEIQKVSWKFCFFCFNYEIDFSFDKQKKMDRRLGLAIASLFVLSNERIFSIENIKRFIYLQWRRLTKRKRRKAKDA